VRKSAEALAFANEVSLSPDGKMLFIADGRSNDVSVVVVAANAIVKMIKAGTGPWGVITHAK